MSQCQAREGFLFKHPCSQAANSRCADCNKAICREHGYDRERGLLCVTCLKKEKHASTEESRRHHDTHDDYYYSDPYFYSSTYYVGYGHSRYHHDAHDFTEGDGAAVLQEGEDGFEHDLEAS